MYRTPWTRQLRTNARPTDLRGVYTKVILRRMNAYATRKLSGRIAMVAVVLLLITFATLSYSAILGKSATADEPLHLVGGAVHRFCHDYRINFEDPPLLGWWASLPLTRTTFNLNTNSSHYRAAVQDSGFGIVPFFLHTMYPKGSNHDAALDRSRACFLLLGIGLGALIAWWAYQLGGPVAAIAAAALFCLDPNFLAHAPLVKNDVPLSLLMCAMCYVLWRFGLTGRYRWLGGAVALSVLAANTKFSGLLLFPMMGTVLIGRAVLRYPMRAGTRTLRNWRSKAMFLLLAGIVAGGTFWLTTWAVYGFRYSATADGKPLNSEWIRVFASYAQAQIEASRDGHNGIPEAEQEHAAWDARQRIPVMLRSCTWWIDSKVMPEAWMYGFLYTYATTLSRQTFLLGHIRQTGWWYYFPAAMLFKTPTATLMLFCTVAIGWIVARQKRGMEPRDEDVRFERSWAMLALGIPAAIYLFAALTTNLNLGLRHVLPVYPLLYVVGATGFALMLRAWPRPMMVVGLLALAGLACESGAAYPNYIPFFNLASGGSRGGLELLTDCNLDWGQDLPDLARWQQKHPDKKLYLMYFGPADPASYGIRYANISPDNSFRPVEALGPEPGVVAVSASYLQGVRISPDSLVGFLRAMDPDSADPVSQIDDEPERNEAASRALRQLEPREVIDGSIYLFDWPSHR